MLDYSRTTRTTITTQEVDFQHLIACCIKELEFMPHFARLQVQLCVQGEAFYSDAFRLQVILSNLLTNAVKYQYLGRAESQVTISVQLDKQFAYLTITDNGIGIEEKYLPRIFDMFFRASEQSQGSGLGMYIVKQTVEKLGGTIRLESTFGEGTTVTLRIPNTIPTGAMPAQEALV
jgi:signal transduction histidine kinase